MVPFSICLTTVFYAPKKVENTRTVSKWSATPAVSRAECMAHIAQPISTPLSGICDVSMLPSVEPPSHVAVVDEILAFHTGFVA